jgi:hypothetical protein
MPVAMRKGRRNEEGTTETREAKTLKQKTNENPLAQPVERCFFFGGGSFLFVPRSSLLQRFVEIRWLEPVVLVDYSGSWPATARRLGWGDEARGCRSSSGRACLGEGGELFVRVGQDNTVPLVIDEGVQDIYVRHLREAGRAGEGHP